MFMLHDTPVLRASLGRRGVRPIVRPVLSGTERLSIRSGYPLHVGTPSSLAIRAMTNRQIGKPIQVDHRQCMGPPHRLSEVDDSNFDSTTYGSCVMEMSGGHDCRRAE